LLADCRARIIGSVTRTHFQLIHFGAIAIAAALCMPALPARAQEKFLLDDQDQWQQQQAPDPGTPEGELHAIRRALAEGDADTALELAQAWALRYPNHPLLVDAFLLLGDAHVANRDYYKALYEYENVIRGYPGSEQFYTAVTREYEIARLFAAGMKRRLWGLRMIPADDEAEEIFIRIQERMPGSPIGEKASIALADYYYDRAQMKTALEAYDLFLLNYPRSQYRERAMLRLIQASLATFKGPLFDATGLIEAGQRLQQFQQEFPAAAERVGSEALLVRIEESLALKAYYTAEWYEKNNKDVSAVYMYRSVIRDYPRTGAAREALRRLEALGKPVRIATGDEVEAGGDGQPEGGR
jgi:outer membrane assembly lipoprotein YfiO